MWKLDDVDSAEITSHREGYRGQVRLELAADSGQPASAHSIKINGVEIVIDSTEITSFTIDGADGNDSVVIHGSVGNDTLRMHPYYATLTGPGYQVDVVRTANITVIGGGGTDKAYLYDSAGNDRFYGKATVSWLTGDGFTNVALGFNRVDAYATAGGTDRAYLYDLALDDFFEATGNQVGTSFAESSVSAFDFS